MKKTEHKKKAYAMTLRVHSESGRAEITMGIDEMSAEERRLLFNTIRLTRDVGFGLQDTGAGEKTLTLSLKEAQSAETASNAAIQHTH